MAQGNPVETNNIQISQRDKVGNNAGSWRGINVREITRFNNEQTQSQATNISRNRQNLKSKVTSTTSGVAYGAFLTLDALDAVAQELFFAKFRNRDSQEMAVSATSSTTDAFTISAANDDQRAVLKSGSLVWARGFGSSDNNGLHVLDTDVASNGTSVAVSSNLQNESGLSGAFISFAGIRIATGTSKTWAYDASSKRGTLTSTGIQAAAVGLHEGMFVYIGSKATADGDIENAFQDTSANDIYGKARVRAINTNSIVFDKLGANLEASDSTSPNSAVDIVYGAFVTNVSQDSPLNVKSTREYEEVLPDFGTAGTDYYRYSDGNIINTVTLSVPTDDYASMTIATLGTLTQKPTVNRRAGADAATESTREDTFVTGRDIARVTFDRDTQGYDITVFDMTWTMSNNLSNKNAVAVVGSWRINTGNFTVSVSLDLSLSDPNLEDVIEGNEAISITSVFQNTEGVIIGHIPSMTLSRDSETYTLGDVVTVTGTASAFQDPVFKTSASFSTFPVPFTREQL